MIQEDLKSKQEEQTLQSRVREIVIYNDDFNTFDFVIQTLIEVCKHDHEQAEQCTMIIHYNGKCAVKSGTYAEIKPMKEEIVNRGINAVIE